MNGIEFEGENREAQEFGMKSRKLLCDPETPSLAKFLINKGIVKNGIQAKYLLIGVICFSLILSFFIGFGINKGSDTVVFPDGKTISIKEYNAGLKTGLYK